MLPSWFEKDLDLKAINEMQKMLHAFNLNTVCEEAFCPNISECFTDKTVTFLILGKHCTRNCRFCNVEHGKPEMVNNKEPDMIVNAIRHLNLKYVVITSVTRDDLEDCGAFSFVSVVNKIKSLPEVKIELLIPDFKGIRDLIKIVVDSKPEVIAHNIETVKRLYPRARPQANYERSLSVLKTLKELDKNLITKSGIMLGLGESQNEIETTIKNIRATGCDILTIGQYLRPSKEHLALIDYITPQMFEYYKGMAYGLGFTYVESSVFSRSSYHAKEAYLACIKNHDYNNKKN